MERLYAGILEHWSFGSVLEHWTFGSVSILIACYIFEDCFCRESVLIWGDLMLDFWSIGPLGVYLSTEPFEVYRF